MAFCSLLRRWGSPVDKYLSRNGLPVLCVDPDFFVPLPRVWSFFVAAAQIEGPELGWLAGEHVGDHNLNARILRKLESAPTLLMAIKGLMQFVRAEASDVSMGIHERQEDILVFIHYPELRELPGYDISQAYQLEVIIDLIRHFLGRNWVPTEIGIQAPRVPQAAEKQFPGCRVLTGQQAGYIAVPRSCLYRAPLFRSSEVGKSRDPTFIEDFGYVGTLREMLKAYLSEGYPSARFAASLMDTSVRTLTRRLSNSGLTYGTLVDELRFETAKKELQNPGLRIGDIAQSVGFQDQGDFTRMFYRVGGLTPKEYRNAIKS